MSDDPNSTTAPRWQRRPEARADEILDAAESIFGEQGFARAKLEDVAKRAGVSKGTLYLYFDSKEALFQEMVRAKIVSLVVAGEEMLRTHTGPTADLLIQLMRALWISKRRPNMARMGRLIMAEADQFPELARFYMQDVVLRGRRLMQAIIDRGVTNGEFRPVPNGFAARAIPSLLVHQAQSQCILAGFDPDPLTDEQVFDGIIDIVLRGLLAHDALPVATPS